MSASIEGDLREEYVEGKHIIYTYTAEGKWQKVHECAMQTVQQHIPTCQKFKRPIWEILREDIERHKRKE